MSAFLTINVINNEPATQKFYIFQQPATYTGGATVYSNSLFSQSLGNYGTTMGQLTFNVNTQFYACFQEANATPQIGQSSGFGAASRAIELAPATGTSLDWTTASLIPLGLSQPVAGTGVQPGAFRITTPVFSPPPIYNVGSAVQANGGIVLSNFVIANPSNNTDCQPILKYYVQTGAYAPGTVINFTQSSVNAAVCDFTGGHSVINVVLNADGTWTTTIIR